MRGIGISIVVLAAGCKFTGPGGVAGDDAPPIDAKIDAPPPDASPDAPNLARKKRIMIDHTKVTDDQTAFPVWIVLSSDDDLKARATETGADIYFTTSNGTPLEYQIQRWSRSTGRLEAWVRTDLADTAPTLIDLHYGDPARTQPQRPSMVFSSSFAAVWHLDDQAVTTTIADAKNMRNGTPMGLVDNDRVTGQLGGGIRFDGGTKQITFTNPYMGNGPHTISAWIDQKTATGTCDTIVAMGNPAAQQSRWFHSHHTANDRGCVGFYANDWFNPANMNLENDGWVLVHWVFENGVSRLYRDGVPEDTNTHAVGINTQGMEGYIGYAPALWGTCGLTGTLDEVRLATVARTAGWIKTEYENQKSPTSFYDVGDEEMGP